MNENKFDKKGSVYSKYRPGYPAALFEYFTKKNIISAESICADIGAGTGIFTKSLSHYAGSVFAAEPNENMLFAAKNYLQGINNVTLINSNAENTKLPSNSIDVVFAAQSFHWFDKNKFRSECKRILKPGGMVVLVWNNREEEQPLMIENFKINQKFCHDFKGFSKGLHLANESLFCDFFNGEFEAKTFKNPIKYNEDEFIGRNCSSSYAPVKGDENFNGYVVALKDLFLHFNQNGTVDYPYETVCYIGSV